MKECETDLLFSINYQFLIVYSRQSPVYSQEKDERDESQKAKV